MVKHSTGSTGSTLVWHAQVEIAVIVAKSSNQKFYLLIKSFIFLSKVPITLIFFMIFRVRARFPMND
jgi:hypothetical protein